MNNEENGNAISTSVLTRKELEDYARQDFPSETVLVAKSITLTEESKWEMEQIREMVRCSGIDISVSEMIRLCISDSWEASVKPKLCQLAKIPTPSFKSI